MAYGVRVTDRSDWLEIWKSDKRSIEETMRRNIADDVTAGYDPSGHAILRQALELNDYIYKTQIALNRLSLMEEKEANKWCFYDLKKRGAIA